MPGWDPSEYSPLAMGPLQLSSQRKGGLTKSAVGEIQPMTEGEFAAVEEEQGRLSAYFRTEGPIANSLSDPELWAVRRAVRENPQLASFRSDGLERFLGNAGVLPDGRPLFVFHGRPEATTKLLYLVWGSVFGFLPAGDRSDAPAPEAGHADTR
jgi:hypothetical protein